MVAALVLLFTAHPTSLTMRVGEVASQTVIAPRKVIYVDRVATAAREQQAREAVTPVYRTDVSVARARRQQAVSFLAEASRIVASRLPLAAKEAALQKLLPAGTQATSLAEFVTLTPKDYGVVQAESLALLNRAMEWQFDSNQIPTIELNLLSTLPHRVSDLQRASINEVLAAFLAPTLREDAAATAREQRNAANSVPPVMNEIQEGEVIVRRGDLVSQSVVDKLTALGLQSHQTGWRDVASALLFAGVVIITLFWYLYAFHSGIIGNPRLLLLIDISILAAVFGARVLGSNHVLLPYFLPVAAASTFAAVLMAPEACVAFTLAMAILCGWMVANSFELTVYYFISGSAGVLAVRHLRQLKQFILAGVSITAFALATALAFAIVDRSNDFAALREYAAAAVVNGFVSSTLALGAFALLSDLFGVTTVLNLLELGQPSQPLLRRLMTRAPGTYNHSLIVGTMVERAAEEIGANSLVAKVGALYHDVGKTSNPLAFVENQLGVGNIHDELNPNESARIIRAHVSHGLRLARQYRLPQAVVDAISEHHGTMTIAYFLHKARQENGDVPVDIALYSYPGPKPQSKETALIMLADGCESTVRSTQDHSAEKIREIVDRIFTERVEGGQLSECPLTLHDLELARSAFRSVLNGLYHPRIEYPEPVETILDGRGGAQADSARLGVPSASGSNETA